MAGVNRDSIHEWIGGDDGSHWFVQQFGSIRHRLVLWHLQWKHVYIRLLSSASDWPRTFIMPSRLDFMTKPSCLITFNWRWIYHDIRDRWDYNDVERYLPTTSWATDYLRIARQLIYQYRTNTLITRARTHASVNFERQVRQYCRQAVWHLNAMQLCVMQYKFNAQINVNYVESEAHG